MKASEEEASAWAHDHAAAVIQAGRAGGFDTAAVGDASEAGAGGYNLKEISELLRLFD